MEGLLSMEPTLSSFIKTIYFNCLNRNEQALFPESHQLYIRNFQEASFLESVITACYGQLCYIAGAAALVQTVKSQKGLSGKICPREVPRVIRLSRGAQPQGKV